jgi:hypothetical protein
MIRLFQIKAPHFVAGFCVDAKNTIWKAAPIIRWLEDRNLYVAESYCRKRGWKLLDITEKEEAVGIEEVPAEVAETSIQAVA